MPAASVFLDANFLLYLHDRRTPEKAALAQDWLEQLAAQNAARTNLQVLNEVTSVLLRRRWFSDPEEAFRIVDETSTFGSSPINWAEVTKARRIHMQTRYSWWDSLLLASALELGCTHFLSEDLASGQAIGGLTIVDPFSTSPGSIFL